VGPAPDAEEGPLRHLWLVRLASWNVIDQVLSALTNIALTIVVNHNVDKAGFGAFAASFLVFSVCIGIERALVGQPMSIRYSGASGTRLDSGRSRALGTALLVGLAGAAGCIVAGLALGGRLGPTLIATGAVMPLLLLQDACRLIFFARSEAKLAAANDALWGVVQFIGITVVVLAGKASAPALVLVWGLAAGVCVVVALIQLRVVPNVRGVGSWMGEHRDMSGYLLAEYLLGAGAFQGGILVVGALQGGPEGLAIIGAFRAAQVVLGPLNMLGTALQTFALPELSKRDWLTRLQRWKVAVLIGGFMAAVAASYAVLLLLLPHGAGALAFRDSWDGGRAVLLPLATGTVFWALWQGCTIVIYAMGLARRAFWIMAVEAPLVFALMIGGAELSGAQGAAWGMCLVQVSSLPLWIWTLRLVLKDPGRHAGGRVPTPLAE
jgi:O-antigen/teichoic acid export membrane protein